jgi:hypothetical protein
MPEGRTAPEVVFHHSIDCMHVCIDVFYLLLTHLLELKLLVVVNVEVMVRSWFSPSFTKLHKKAVRHSGSVDHLT